MPGKSSKRGIYEVADQDSGGVLVDLLGKTLERLDQRGRSDLKWTVFDLDWLQRENGILQAERVSRRSAERPDGWRLDDHGIRLFRQQYVQVIEGFFFAGSHHFAVPAGEPVELLIPQSEIALQAFDSTIWRLSCRDEQIAREILADFKQVCRVDVDSRNEN
jgi:hypothetical protein